MLSQKYWITSQTLDPSTILGSSHDHWIQTHPLDQPKNIGSTHTHPFDRPPKSLNPQSSEHPKIPAPNPLEQWHTTIGSPQNHYIKSTQPYDHSHSHLIVLLPLDQISTSIESLPQPFNRPTTIGSSNNHWVVQQPLGRPTTIGSSNNH